MLPNIEKYKFKWWSKLIRYPNVISNYTRALMKWKEIVPTFIYGDAKNKRGNGGQEGNGG